MKLLYAIGRLPFFAKPSDYTRATQRVYHAALFAGAVDVPVVTSK
jgi:hypothetical protein